MRRLFSGLAEVGTSSLAAGILLPRAQGGSTTSKRRGFHCNVSQSKGVVAIVVAAD